MPNRSHSEIKSPSIASILNPAEENKDGSDYFSFGEPVISDAQRSPSERVMKIRKRPRPSNESASPAPRPALGPSRQSSNMSSASVSALDTSGGAGSESTALDTSRDTSLHAGIPDGGPKAPAGALYASPVKTAATAGPPTQPVRTETPSRLPPPPEKKHSAESTSELSATGHSRGSHSRQSTPLHAGPAQASPAAASSLQSVSQASPSSASLPAPSPHSRPPIRHDSSGSVSLTKAGGGEWTQSGAPPGSAPGSAPLGGAAATSQGSVTAHSSAPMSQGPSMASNHAQHPTPDLTSLQPSIFNVEPIDEFTREVADWIWAFGRSSQNWEEIEIEAKLGVLVDRRTHARCAFPIPIETIITDDAAVFESTMTQHQHRAYNQLLNSLVEASATPQYTLAPVKYAHSRETDFTYNVGGQRIRVTKDDRDPSRNRALIKSKLSNMNIVSPKRAFDWRISVNHEKKVPLPQLPPSAPYQSKRHKDRISYSHQLFQIDLTQVVGDNAQLSHELEVEFKNPRVLLEEAQKDAQGLDNRYMEMVQCFLNNIRMLIRNAS